jgi:hypothetical protein
MLHGHLIRPSLEKEFCRCQLKRLISSTKTFKRIDTKKRRSASYFFQTTENLNASTASTRVVQKLGKAVGIDSLVEGFLMHLIRRDSKSMGSNTRVKHPQHQL